MPNSNDNTNNTSNTSNTSNNSNTDELIKKITELIDNLSAITNNNNTKDVKPPLSKEEIERRKYENLIKREKEKEAKDDLDAIKKRNAEALKLFEENSEERKDLEKIFKDEENEIIKKEFEKSKNIIKDGWSKIVGSFTKAKDMVFKSWGEADQAASTYGRTIGMNVNEINRLRREVVGYFADTKLSARFDVDIKEMLKLQGSYNKELGRAVALNKDNYATMGALRLLMGDASAIKFTANLDKFGLDLDAANEMATEFFNETNNKGVVLERVTENFLNNIDLAQQYNFEDGVEGLKKMAISASAIRWDMSQTAAFAEKVNSVEGAVKTGAQLSVLGGPFAQFSNPMGMLYESLNDLEGLQERIFAMFGRLGEWNNEKGQLDISVFNKQRIRAASQAMGISYSKVIDTVNAQARKKRIEEQLSNSDYNSDIKELLSNLGQIDKSGRAYVQIGDNKKYLDEENLTNKDIEILESRTKSETDDIKTIAENTKSLLEIESAGKKELSSQMANTFENSGIGTTLKGAYKILNQYQHFLQYVPMILTSVGMIGGMTMLSKGLGRAVKSYNTMRLAGTPAMTALGGSVSKIIPFATSATLLGTSIGSMALSNTADKKLDEGNFNAAKWYGRGSSALAGLGIGAQLFQIHPYLGIAGTLLGGLAGWVYGDAKRNKQIKEKERIYEINNIHTELRNKGYALNGTNYSLEELQNIRKGRNYISGALPQKMYNNNDEMVLQSLPQTLAKGGIINGPSHSNGGVAIPGSNIEVEGGEFVINKYSTEKYLPELKAINNDNITPLKPMGDILKVESISDYTKQDYHMNFDDLNMGVNGTIKLDLGGYTHDIDTRGLLSNPSFIRGMRDEIIKQINYTTDKSFRKDKYYRKL